MTKENKEKSTLYPIIQEVSKNIYPSIEAWFEAFQTEDFKLENDSEKE